MKGWVQIVAGLLLAPVVPAQEVDGITRIEVQGPAAYARMNLDTGVVQDIGDPTAAPTNPGCFANDVDVDPADATCVVGSSCLDALLFPAGDELFDWGVKNCGGSDFVESIVIGYASQAVPTSQSGPGGSLVLRVYEHALGFGTPGTEVASIALSGLPSDTIVNPLTPRFLTIELGSRSFFLPDGPLGWSYENPDGLTAPLLTDVTIANGTQNYFDVYRPGPASDGHYLGTFSLPAGGASNDPIENSFYLIINENDTVAQQAAIPAGGNPNVLTAGLPIVGSPWLATVDLSGFPSATGSVLVVTGGDMPVISTPFGTLLLDLNTRLARSVQAGGLHSLTIPIDSELVGLQFFAQGVVLTGPPMLTNGVGCTVGTF